MGNQKQRNQFVWPDLAVKEFLTAVALTTILIIWALLVNAPLMEIANPGISENPSKAPWYFVGLQELLVYFDPWIAGVVIPSVIIAALIMIPYLDNNPGGGGEYALSLRKFAASNFIAGFSLWWILILIGYFLRGPNWQLYWPWESWDTVKQVEENLWSLSPWTGCMSLLIYFGAGMFLPRLVSTNLFRRCGLPRYMLITFLMLLMYAVPIKILLRILFNIQYVLVTPWFNI